MKQELEKKLVEKYPKIFGQIRSTPQQSCMAFGIETGDGWYWLLDNLCKGLQHNIDNNGQPQIVAAQVKEKFGGLRFYVNSATDEQYAIISFVEDLSYSICESCGSTENISQTEGYIRTLCSSCRDF